MNREQIARAHPKAFKRCMQVGDLKAGAPLVS